MTTRSLSLSSTKAKLVAFAILLALTSVVPSFIHIQWLTGPLVNTTLFLAVVLVGPMEAVTIGLVPSVVALSSGLLPLPLAPMVPFIMLGNAILVATFHYLRKTNIYGALIVAAFLKFAFLYGSVVIIMQKLLEKNFVEKLAVMMSWPQFLTALIGGAIALGILKGLKKL